MRFKSIAFMAVAAIIAIAPQAFATDPDGITPDRRVRVHASEPLTMFAVGIGLLGARYLRRRT